MKLLGAVLLGFTIFCSSAVAADVNSANHSKCYGDFRADQNAVQRAALDRACRETQNGIKFYNAKNDAHGHAGYYKVWPCSQPDPANAPDVNECQFRVRYYTPTPSAGAADWTVCRGVLAILGHSQDWRGLRTHRKSVACVA
jgi:hypothetical protein